MAALKSHTLLLKALTELYAAALPFESSTGQTPLDRALREVRELCGFGPERDAELRSEYAALELARLVATLAHRSEDGTVTVAQSGVPGFVVLAATTKNGTRVEELEQIRERWYPQVSRSRPSEPWSGAE